MLSSLGHDDIQFQLMTTTFRKKLVAEYSEEWTGIICKEYRIKKDYEPEIFIDILETDKIHNRARIWEIKPELHSLGEVLRQINKYRQIVKYHIERQLGIFCEPNSITVYLVYQTSNIPKPTILSYFGNESVRVCQITSNDCKRLEET